MERLESVTHTSVSEIEDLPPKRLAFSFGKCSKSASSFVRRKIEIPVTDLVHGHPNLF
jgi:hypothetical protein